MESRPLKRNENIVILSREHHQGLLFGWKLRQGLRNRIEPERMAKYVSYFWDTHLMEHFREEETLLFTDVQDALVDKGIQQHIAIKTLVIQILAEGKDNSELYGRLADLITDHIRFEERELFPHLESVLSPEQLGNIGDELARLHQTPAADDYPDEFWRNKEAY
jgi:hemerythrin-like domain-containing protein